MLLTSSSCNRNNSRKYAFEKFAVCNTFLFLFFFFVKSNVGSLREGGQCRLSYKLIGSKQLYKSRIVMRYVKLAKNYNHGLRKPLYPLIVNMYSNESAFIKPPSLLFLRWNAQKRDEFEENIWGSTRWNNLLGSA